jgi:hypothetical protein
MTPRGYLEEGSAGSLKRCMLGLDVGTQCQGSTAFVIQLLALVHAPGVGVHERRLPARHYRQTIVSLAH